MPYLTTEKMLREIVTTSVAATSHQCFYFPDVIEKATAAAMAVRHLGQEVIIDAIEREMKRQRCAFLFDDPCDTWAVYDAGRY